MMVLNRKINIINIIKTPPADAVTKIPVSSIFIVTFMYDLLPLKTCVTRSNSMR